MTNVFVRRRSPVRAHRVIVASCASPTCRAHVPLAPIDSRAHSRHSAHPRSHVQTTEWLAPRLLTTRPRSLKLQ
jgi:hypothetical protein